MADMIVDVRKMWDKKLWAGSANHYNYSTLCEGYIAEAIARQKQWSIDAITVGRDDRYDLILSGHKIEVKTSTGYLLKIEYRREDGRPSGISTTESQWYAMLNTSRNGDGKLRLISKNVLLSQLYQKLELGLSKYAQGADGEQGYYYVHINPYDDLYGKDGWICNVPFVNATDANGNATVIYNLGPAPQEWGHSVTQRLHRELTIGL